MGAAPFAPPSAPNACPDCPVLSAVLDNRHSEPFAFLALTRPLLTWNPRRMDVIFVSADDPHHLVHAATVPPGSVPHLFPEEE